LSRDRLGPVAGERQKKITARADGLFYLFARDEAIRLLGAV
jgi:hypothetical protein